MDAICEVVVTGPDEEQLVSLTRRLITERLVACGQHVTAIRSVYRWDGEVQDEPEARVMLHTRQTLVPMLMAAIRDHHPYDVPCVLVTPVSVADPDYHRWVVDGTRPAES